MSEEAQDIYKEFLAESPENKDLPIEFYIEWMAEKITNSCYIIIDLAKELLLITMQNFSEAAYCAGWNHGLEEDCKDAVSGKLNGYGRLDDDEFNAYKIKLTTLHALCNGWWRFKDDPTSSEWYEFVPDNHTNGVTIKGGE